MRRGGFLCVVERNGPRAAEDWVGSCAVRRYNAGSCLVWPHHVHHSLYSGPLLDTRTVASTGFGDPNEAVLVFVVLVHAHQ